MTINQTPRISPHMSPTDWISPFWDNVFRISTFAAMVLGGTGILAAFISAWVGYKITDATQRQADTLIAQANEAAAKSNERANTLAVQLEQLRIDQGPRAAKANIAWLGGNGGLPSILKANPPGEALVWYLPSDPEAEGFARELWSEITYSGWKTHGYIQPIPVDVPLREAEEMRRAEQEKLNGFSLVPINGAAPLIVATSGGRSWDAATTVQAKALLDGLLKSGFPVQGAGNNNPLVPPNVVLLVVGQKQ